MRRRACLSVVGGAAAAWSLIAGAGTVRAQAPNRIYRLGHLASATISETFTREIALPELARLGFVEGRNLEFHGRVGRPDAMPGLMGELLALRPDAVIVVGPAALRAAGAATRSVPVVAFGVDPVEAGLATSYARPGGNVTGVVILATELEAKRLSILLEAVPERRRVAVLTSAALAQGLAALRTAVAGLGVELLPFPVAGPGDYPAAFAAMRAAGAQSLLIGATSEFYRDARQLAALALEARLPTVCEWADMARAGCLIGYGPNRTALRRRMAAQVARILDGAAPGDIAIERPTVFEFAVNQQVARSLDLRIPSAVLVQADELLE